MVYRAIGLMSGSSLDGLDIVFAEFQESAGKWTYQIQKAACLPYEKEWMERLASAPALSARDYLRLDADYGHYLGQLVNQFIEDNGLQFQVAVVASHGHTSFHQPPHYTAQLGEGAAIAAETGLPVVSDLRALDVALGGQGAPIVPIGERLLLPEHSLLLNIGGIANISVHTQENTLAFDICPANRVLNHFAARLGMEFDKDGQAARQGQVQKELLQTLNAFDFYQQPPPKSLANEFGTETLVPLLEKSELSTNDILCTYVEHIAVQVKKSIMDHATWPTTGGSLLVTGGGAFNQFLIARLTDHLQPLGITVTVPEANLVKYKEALIMALLGVLRWRDEYSTIPSATGAKRGSIGGALWNGQEE